VAASLCTRFAGHDLMHCPRILLATSSSSSSATDMDGAGSNASQAQSRHRSATPGRQHKNVKLALEEKTSSGSVIYLNATEPTLSAKTSYYIVEAKADAALSREVHEIKKMVSRNVFYKEVLDAYGENLQAISERFETQTRFLQDSLSACEKEVLTLKMDYMAVSEALHDSSVLLNSTQNHLDLAMEKCGTWCDGILVAT